MYSVSKTEAKRLLLNLQHSTLVTETFIKEIVTADFFATGSVTERN